MLIGDKALLVVFVSPVVVFVVVKDLGFNCVVVFERENGELV